MRFCTSCGAAVDASMRFCGRCGHPLGGPTTKAAAGAPTSLPPAQPPKGHPPGVPPTKAYPTGAGTGDRDRMLVRLVIGGAVLALVLVAIFSLGGDDGGSPGNVFHPEGFGSIEIGMTEDQVEGVTDGVDWEPAFPDQVGGCSYVDFDQYDDLHGLSGDGLHLGYIEVNDYEQSGLEARTVEGVALGDDEERVEEVYNDVEVTTRPYGVEPDHWLIVDLADGNKYVFGTTNGRIDQIRVGRAGDVEAIEGCL